MEFQKVVSSNLASIGYDDDTATLAVQFNNGTLYHYHDVPRQVYEGLMSASSHGQYLDKHVKKNGYRYTRIK
jgi:hypothetical protein